MKVNSNKTKTLTIGRVVRMQTKLLSGNPLSVVNLWAVILQYSAFNA